MNYNKSFIIGRLTKDPRIAKTSSGISYLRGSIAVNRSVPNNDDVTDFIPFVAWRSNAEFIANYVPKGSLVALEGPIITTSREVNGQTINSFEIRADFIIPLENAQVREQRRMQNGGENTQTMTISQPNYNSNYQQKGQQTAKNQQFQQNIASQQWTPTSEVPLDDDTKFTGEPGPTSTPNAKHEINWIKDDDDE
ncbi:single-stranded DNA-binding protein [Mycoplasmopsis adleri]|uniref:single-stranded DNA-binding protein n=1 Tax=Mycoplasmopsis adleri TaxID=51362 RepID=UPI0038735BD3